MTSIIKDHHIVHIDHHIAHIVHHIAHNDHRIDHIDHHIDHIDHHIRPGSTGSKTKCNLEQTVRSVQ